MSINWDYYTNGNPINESTGFLEGLIPHSEIVSTVFIIAVAFAGLYIARWMYSKL